MIEFDATGCCKKCGEPCFKVLARWGADGRYPGEPCQLGEPLEGSVRVRFSLYSGGYADMTFCAACDVGPLDYVPLWDKALRTWKREMAMKGDEPGDWYFEAQRNGILAEESRTLWKELMNG